MTWAIASLMRRARFSVPVSIFSLPTLRFAGLLAGAAAAVLILPRDVQAQALTNLQAAYVEQGSGLFLHFNMGTFTGEEWASPNQPVDTFHPTMLDTDQWAAAATNAGMAYGVLTAKHHDGFALWDTSQSTYDVASTAWYADREADGREGDIVQRFADSFRAAGLNVGLYYSIWDRSNGIDGSTLSSQQATDYVMAELSELLTNYGPVAVIWTDGWGWKEWHDYVDYETVYNHIKSLSPTTLLVENSHTETNTDIRTYEQSPLPTVCKTFPAEISPTIRLDNKRFFSAGADETKPADVLISLREMCNRRFAACLMDATPDTNGLIPDAQMSVLEEVGSGQPVLNMALNGDTTQSSVWADWPLVLTSDQAVDGIFAQRNMAHTAMHDTNARWRVKLTTPCRIAKVAIQNRPGFAGRLRDITIEILDAGRQLVLASELLNPGNCLGGGESDYANGPAVLEWSPASPVLGHFVRISREAEGSADEDQYALTLPEVQVYCLATERLDMNLQVYASGDGVTVVFDPLAGYDHYVGSRDSLAGGSSIWTVLPGAPHNSGTVLDSRPYSAARFYRVVVVP